MVRLRRRSVRILRFQFEGMKGQAVRSLVRIGLKEMEVVAYRSRSVQKEIGLRCLKRALV